MLWVRGAARRPCVHCRLLLLVACSGFVCLVGSFLIEHLSRLSRVSFFVYQVMHVCNGTRDGFPGVLYRPRTRCDIFTQGRLGKEELIFVELRMPGRVGIVNVKRWDSKSTGFKNRVPECVCTSVCHEHPAEVAPLH